MIGYGIARGLRATLQRDGAASDEAVARDDGVDDRLWTGASLVTAMTALGFLAAGVLVRLTANRGGDDVEPVLAEDGADLADHARHVAVAEQREVVLQLEVEALSPRLQQMRTVQAAENRADDTHVRLAADDRDAHEIGEVARGRALRLGDVDPTLLGEARSVRQKENGFLLMAIILGNWQSE